MTIPVVFVEWRLRLAVLTASLPVTIVLWVNWNDLIRHVGTLYNLILCFSVGSVFTLFPHSLHNEMAQRPVRTPSVPDVSSGVEVSRVDPDLLSPLSLSYESDLPPLPESLSRLSLYDVPPSRIKPEPARRNSPKPIERVGSPKQICQSPVSSDCSDKRPTEKPPVPPRKPSSVDLKLANLRNEMVI